MTSFGKLEACGQTVLPDRSVLIGQKLVENAKIKILMRHFQTMCTVFENHTKISHFSLNFRAKNGDDFGAKFFSFINQARFARNVVKMRLLG